MEDCIKLAKQAVEKYVETGEIIDVPENVPKEILKRKRGVFVTIEQEGPEGKRLRGCIGTYLPTKENVAEEIIQNAITAATEDYRFGPIQKEELVSLTYTVYILNPPELVKGREGLNPQKYGILVKTRPITSPDGTDVVFNGHFVPKSALLLPGLKGIDTIEKQISVACQKGGINPEKEKIIIYRFTAEKYAQ